MDRRERYDPEDIEILMQERSFDELLEEERAYVLRHVSDRAEYEAMRSLLIHMRDDARDQEPIEADPAIRANVLQAFRNEQQPQWRIWLNSVGASLFPEEAKAMWRPALALAGLALVVVVSVLVVRQAGLAPQELAEIRPEKTVDQVPQPAGPVKEDRPEQEQEADPFNAVLLETRDVASAEVAEQTISASESVTQSVEDMPLAKTTAPAQPTSVLGEQELAKVSESVREEEITDSETLTLSHVVTADELSRNMSVANATGKVQAKEQRAAALDAAKSTASKSMADHPALLELVAAGW